MSFVELELDKTRDEIQRLVDEANKTDSSVEGSGRFRDLYVIQQSLAWAIDPKNYRSPFDMVMGINAPADADISSKPQEAGEDQKLGFYFYGAGEDLRQQDKDQKPVTDEQKKEFIEMIERWANEG